MSKKLYCAIAEYNEKFINFFINTTYDGFCQSVDCELDFYNKKCFDIWCEMEISEPKREAECIIYEKDNLKICMVYAENLTRWQILALCNNTLKNSFVDEKILKLNSEPCVMDEYLEQNLPETLDIQVNEKFDYITYTNDFKYIIFAPWQYYSYTEFYFNFEEFAKSLNPNK